MIYITILNIAIFQGIVLGLLILKSSLFNSNSNKYLAYLIFTLLVILLNHIFEIQRASTSYPILRFIEHIEWIFLIPALLFLFIINRIDDTVKSRQKGYLCFIPFAYSAILNITYDLDRVAGIYTIAEPGIDLIEMLGLIHLALTIIFIPFLPLYSYSLIRY